MFNFLQKPVNDDSIKDCDTNDIIRKQNEEKGPSHDHITSYDNLINEKLSEILSDSYGTISRTTPAPSFKNASSVLPGKEIISVTTEVRFSNVDALPPQTINRDTGVSSPMTPAFARANKHNYISGITASSEVKLIANHADGSNTVRTYKNDNKLLLRKPCMLLSSKCILNNMPSDIKLNIGEDPLDLGGVMFIGNNWVVRHQEGIRPNQVRTFNNDHNNEITRSEMLSKPNNSVANSAQLIIRYMANKSLTINIVHKPFEDLHFPFYVIFRLLGAKNDKEIVDSILMGDMDSVQSLYIQSILRDNFAAKYVSFSEINSSMSIDEIVNAITFINNDSTKNSSSIYVKNKRWYSDFMRSVDLYLLPHLGKDIFSRIPKYKLLGWIIRRHYYVNMGVYPETDRDDSCNKLVESSGQRLTKMIKTVFNSTLASVILNGFDHAIGLIPFDAISISEILENTLDPTKIEKTIIKSIAGGGQKDIKISKGGKTITSRLNTIQQSGGFLSCTHNLKSVVAQSTGNTSKTSERERDIRRLHPSSSGIVYCPIRTQESENVGKTKEMPVMTFLSTDSSIQLFLLVFDEEVKTGLVIKNPSEDEIIEQKLTEVTINWIGMSIGFTSDPGKLANKIRYLRRSGKIDKYVGINWDIKSNMLIFNCMGDIPVKPVIIVYNNYGDSYTKDLLKNNGDGSDFYQWCALRKSHINDLRSGKVTVEGLVNLGVMDFASVDEISNSYIAKSIEYLEENANNPYERFDYVEIQASLYSLSVLNGVNQNINPGTRNAYAAIHSNHAAGHHAFNWRDKSNGKLSLQIHNEISPLHSIGNMMSITTGFVATIYIILDGHNVEDGQSHSSTVKDSGRCVVQAFENITTTLSNDEQFILPPISNSTRRRNINYSSIDSSTGFPRINSFIKKDDVVIAKVIKKIDNETGETTYIDKSVVYNLLEPGIVINNKEYRNADDILTRETTIIKTRQPELGDKYSSRSGQKGVIGVHYHPNDMYFTADGGIASMLFNPHSMPSRMTISQMTEGLLALMYALNMISHDGTIHSDINMNDIPTKLKEAGLHPDGTVILHNPKTGIPLKTRVYKGMVYYQNLQKSALDKRQVVGDKVARDIITRQPLEGKSANGGLRFGEMERDVALAIGITKFISEKFYYHSNNAQIYVCEKCGTIPTVNITRGVSCRICLDNSRIYAVDTTWSSWVFLNELNAMYKIRIELEDHKYIKK